jgi:hypothetical protein
MQDIRRGPPPDNRLEVMYASASFNDKMLGHGDPIRVREGQRVLFRLLNASATENVTRRDRCRHVLPVDRSMASMIAPVEVAISRETMLRSTPNCAPRIGNALGPVDI